MMQDETDSSTTPLLVISGTGTCTPPPQDNENTDQENES